MARPLVFGEVLFDVFPDGRQLPGGAPFNVAWHLRAFGVDPLFVSAVGADRGGEKIRRLMRQWGMDVCALQTDTAHPSGTVQVRLQDGQPSYEIVADQAYDYIQKPDIDRRQVALLYHGSLAARQSVSLQSLTQLRDRLAAPVFVDINLRAPWWRPEPLHALLRHANWIKLNDEELTGLAQAWSLPGADWQSQAQALRERYDARLVIVTRGARGAALALEDGSIVSEKISHVGKLADTVGAGDAFSAVCILALLKRWSAQIMLERALDFAARICLQPGATAQDPDLYARYRREWAIE